MQGFYAVFCVMTKLDAKRCVKVLLYHLLSKLKKTVTGLKLLCTNKVGSLLKLFSFKTKNLNHSEKGVKLYIESHTNHSLSRMRFGKLKSCNNDY